MLKPTVFTYDFLKGTIYDFEVVGDVLPMHWHGEGRSHITIVARGSFTAKGTNWEKKVSAGDVMDWKEYVQHEFVALEDNSRIINISKSGLESVNEFGEPPQ